MTLDPGYCTFCEIVGGRLQSSLRYEDEDFVVFDNQLDWAPVMLLLVPKKHMTQTELWTGGPVLARLGTLAVRMGLEHCPNGFRILSNFGHDALQTQHHGHLHVVGGTQLGLYVDRQGSVT